MKLDTVEFRAQARSADVRNDHVVRYPLLLVIASLAVLSFGAGAVWAQHQAASRREPQFENDQVQVWKSIVMPNQPLSLHRHDHGRALIALTDGTLHVVDKAGKVLHAYNLKRGTAMWLGVDPPGQMHADVNPNSTPLEVIVVQLKKDR